MKQRPALIDDSHFGKQVMIHAQLDADLVRDIIFALCELFAVEHRLIRE